MTSPISNSASFSPSYNNLIRKALRLARRSTARERALADAVANTELELDETRRRASIGDSGSSTPVEVQRVLRAPKGVDRLAVVYHDGMTIRAMLHPAGKRNPEREAAVWRCMRDTATTTREQKK